MEKAFLKSLILFLVLMFLLSTAWADQIYKIVDLGHLGGNRSYAYAVNNQGQVVGYSFLVSPNMNPRRAFLWEDGNMIDLGTLGGYADFSSANGINDLGQVVGVFRSLSDLNRAFLWEDGNMIDLGTLGGNHDCSDALANNNFSQVVGVSYKNQDNSSWRACLWENGNITNPVSLWDNTSIANDINEMDQVVGSSKNESGEWRAVLWENGNMSDLGIEQSTTHAINNFGQVVGKLIERYNSVDHMHAFLWEGGVITDLRILGEYNSEALAINDSGQVVGYSKPTLNEHRRAVIWNNEVPTYLDDLIPPDTPWEYLYVAEGINEDGQIVGSGIKDGYICAFIMTPATEIDIDIQPGKDLNHINPKSNSVIQVAILATEDFDVSEVDTATILFGRTGNEASPKHIFYRDVDKDGDIDILLQFKTRDTEIQCGDKIGCLTGKNTIGQDFLGYEYIQTVHCK